MRKADERFGTALWTADVARSVAFCGYCAARPEPARSTASRICARCGMGLLLQAQDAIAPLASEPFVVIDGQLCLRAVSQLAEKLVGVSELSAVGRALHEFLEPAERRPHAEAELNALLRNVALSSARPRGTAVLRPRATYGVRHGVRIGRCGPGRAAVIVFEEAL